MFNFLEGKTIINNLRNVSHAFLFKLMSINSCVLKATKQKVVCNFWNYCRNIYIISSSIRFNNSICCYGVRINLLFYVSSKENILSKYLKRIMPPFNLLLIKIAKLELQIPSYCRRFSITIKFRSWGTISFLAILIQSC